jgi:acetyltransferase
MIITAEPAAPRLAIMPAPTAWTRALTTRTGTVMQVRPARPDDAPLLSDFFARLTPEDLRLRFLGPVLRLDDQRLSMMAAVDYRRTMTFLAFDTGGDLVATAMLASGADPERAEVAVSVRSDLKGLGLGWTLLEHTMAYARERGVRVVQSLESADNVEALQVEDDMGFSVRVSPDDVGLRVLERRLAPSSEA